MPTKKAVKKVTRKATAKKAVKKAVPKKATTKKVIGKTRQKPAKQQKKVLVCASDDKCFWTTDGKILRDLEELAEALHHMTDEIFAHHVTKDKNDFANWVEDVLLDGDCADALRRTKKTSAAQKVVVKQLKLYSK